MYWTGQSDGGLWISQIIKNMNKATITGWRILNVENISKPLENMNIKFIRDITVYILNELTKTLYSVSPLCSVKFMNCNLACIEQFRELRLYIIYKKELGVIHYVTQNGLLVVYTFKQKANLGLVPQAPWKGLYTRDWLNNSNLTTLILAEIKSVIE